MLQSPGPLAGSEERGWAETLQGVELATPEIAHSSLKASHVTRTLHVHLVITCVLYILLKNAYAMYDATNAHGSAECINMWCKCRKAESLLFLYWYTGFELELLALAFGHSLHPGDFDLYKDTLTK